MPNPASDNANRMHSVSVGAGRGRKARIKRLGGLRGVLLEENGDGGVVILAGEGGKGRREKHVYVSSSLFYNYELG